MSAILETILRRRDQTHILRAGSLAGHTMKQKQKAILQYRNTKHHSDFVLRFRRFSYPQTGFTIIWNRQIYSDDKRICVFDKTKNQLTVEQY